METSTGPFFGSTRATSAGFTVKASVPGTSNSANASFGQKTFRRETCDLSIRSTSMPVLSR